MADLRQRLLDLEARGRKALPFSAGIGTGPGVASVGASITTPLGQVGGSIGFNRGQPFGSYNVNHKIKGKFGRQ